MNKFILDVGAIRHNILFIKSKLKSGTKFCAMVKANAYGHGIRQVATNIQDLVDYFGVACVSEGLILRNNNIAKDILVVGAYDKSLSRVAILNHLTLTVCSKEDLFHLERKCRALKMVACVNIKINTGMNRLGVNDLNEFKQMLDIIKLTPYIHLTGVFSHFSCSDSDLRFTNKQNKIFKKFIKLVNDKNVIFHISSSYASLKYKKFVYDMVRVGIAMYGYLRDEKSLMPAITIKSNVKALNILKKHSYIGYGATFVATKPMKIATVSLGYADGINLKLSNKLEVLINNVYCRVVGKICMDMFMCDVTNVKDIKIGDEVYVFDKFNNANIWKSFCNTSEYEILTSFKTSRMKVSVINNNI